MDSAVMCQFGDTERITAGTIEKRSPALIIRRLHSDLGAYFVCSAWKPRFNVLLIFVCCLGSSFALNIKEPPAPTYHSWWTILGGVPSTSSLCLQSFPLFCRNSPVKTKSETSKLYGLVLQKRSPKMNLSNIHFKKPWRSLCVSCEKSHYVLSLLSHHSVHLASLRKTGQQMKEAAKAVSKHPARCKKSRSKRSHSASSPLKASLAQNKAVRHRNVMDWVNHLFGVGERLPAQSSIVDEKKISGVSDRLDIANSFNFDNWDESFQNLLGSSVRNVESTINLNQSAHLDPTFRNETTAKDNLGSPDFGPEAGSRALSGLVKPLTLTETGGENLKAVTLVPSTTSKMLFPQVSERFVVLRTRYIESKPVHLRSTAPLLYSSVTGTMNHTRPGIPKVLPLPMASVSEPNSSFDVSASDYSIIPVTIHTKSSVTQVGTETTAAPFEHAITLDRLLLSGGSLNNDHLPNANVLSSKVNSTDKLRVSIHSPAISPIPPSLAVTTDTLINANVGSSGLLPPQHSKLEVGVMTEATQLDSLTDSHSTSVHGFKYNQPGPSFGSTLILPVTVKSNASDSNGTAPTTNNLPNLANSKSLPSSLQSPNKTGPYLGFSDLPTSLQVLTSAAGKNHPMRPSTVGRTETAERRIPPFTSSSISEASGEEHTDRAIGQKSYPLYLVTSRPSAGTLNFRPGRTTLRSLTVTLKTTRSVLDLGVSALNQFGDHSATSMFYSPHRNVPHNSQQRFNTTVTALAPVKQVPSVPAGLAVSLTTSSFYSSAGTPNKYDSILTAKLSSSRASEGTPPSLPEMSSAIHTETIEPIFLGSKISLSPIHDRVKTELYPLPLESVATQAVNRRFTSVSISNSTIKTSDTVQHKEEHTPPILSTRRTKSDTSRVIPFFSNPESVPATVKNNRIKRTLPTQYLSLLSSESFFSTKRASTSKCHSCLFSNSPRPVSASFDTASSHGSSFAHTKPDSSSFSSLKWVTSLDGSFVRRPLTKAAASTNGLVSARASFVDPTLSSYVTPDDAKIGLSTRDTLTGLTRMNTFNLFHSKQRDAVKFSHSTPHEVRTAYSLSPAHTDAVTLTSVSFSSPFSEAWSRASFVKESKLSTAPNYLTSTESTKAGRVKLFVEPSTWKSSLTTVPITYGSTAPIYTSVGSKFHYGSGFTYNSVFEQSRSSISASSYLPGGIQKHSSLNPSNEATTMPTSLSYFTVPSPSSIQASPSQASNLSLFANSSEIKAYESHSPVTKSTFTTQATKSVFSTPSNSASALRMSPAGTFNFNESLNTTHGHRIKTLSDYQSHDGLYTASTASGATLSTHVPTGSLFPNAMIASTSIVARSASKVTTSSPHSIAGSQRTTPHSSIREMSMQNTSNNVVTAPHSTAMGNKFSAFQNTTALDNTIWTVPYGTYKTNDSTNFHQKNSLTFTSVASFYNTPTENVSTSSEQTTPYDSIGSTLLHSPVSVSDDLDFLLDKIAFNNTALATSSHSTVPIPQHPTSTVAYSSIQSPATLPFLQPDSTVLQSSQSSVKSSLLIPTTSTHRLLNASLSPSRPTHFRRSTREKLSAHQEHFSRENTSRHSHSASTQVISTALLPRSSVTEAFFAPHVSVSKIFTNVAGWSTKMDNPLHDKDLTLNITLLANTSDSPPRPNTELNLASSTPVPPVLSTIIVLPLQCRLTGIQYTPDLQNQSSPIYMALAGEVQLTMNKIFSAKYASNFLGTRIKDFLNGSVIAQLDVLFRNDVPPPSSSDVVRTVVTEAYRTTEDHYEWRIAPLSVEANGRSLKNLDPEQVSISFLALGMGFAVSLNNSDSPLERLQTEVLRILRPVISLKKFLLVEVRNLRGDLSINGDLYINTHTHVDSLQILQALRSLVNHSVDLSSIVVAGVRLDLQIYPLRIRILNRALTAQLMDHSTMVFQQFAKELGATVLDILKKGVPPLQMVVRELLSGSVLTLGELIFQSPPPPSKEVLQTLIGSVGSGNVFGKSSFLVDPTYFVVADAKPDVNAEYPHFPGFAVAIIVMCGLVIIAVPVIIFLFLKTNVFGHHGKAIIQRRRDPERGQYNLEMANRGYHATTETEMVAEMPAIAHKALLNVDRAWEAWGSLACYSRQDLRHRTRT